MLGDLNELTIQYIAIEVLIRLITLVAVLAPLIIMLQFSRARNDMGVVVMATGLVFIAAEIVLIIAWLIGLFP